MRRLVLLIYLLPMFCYSQQQTQYSQYLYSLFSLNPAYAGTKNYVQALTTERYQWVGVKGAPHSQSFIIHAPLNQKKMGVGLNIYNESIGAHGVFGVFGSYSYSLRRRSSSLSFGLKGGIYSYRLIDAMNYETENDPYGISNFQQTYIPSFDAGVHYTKKNFVIGGSVANLQESKLGKDQISGGVSNNLKRHYYLYLAYMIIMNEKCNFRPSIMFKGTKAAPSYVDLNFGFIMDDKLHLGISYRTSKSIIGMVQYYITNNIHIGYAYDYNYYLGPGLGSMGTHEILLGFDFRRAKSIMLTPRFL